MIASPFKNSNLPTPLLYLSVKLIFLTKGLGLFDGLAVVVGPKLNLSFCVSITDTGLKSLARSPRLQDLNLCSCDNVSDIGIGFLARTHDFPDMNAPPAAAQLEKLDVSFCSNITDSGMKHIAMGLTHLKTLSVANCTLTDESLTRIAKSLIS